VSTALASIEHLAPEEDCRESSVKNLFLPDLTLWAFFAFNVHRPRAQRPNPKWKRSKKECIPMDREVWTDILLNGGPTEIRMSNIETRAIHVYGVRSDGLVVTHQTRQHRPSEIFKIYPHGSAVLRLFANAQESVGQSWPLDCEGLAKICGTVIMVALDVSGKRSRHMFRFPSSMHELWKAQRSGH